MDKWKSGHSVEKLVQCIGTDESLFILTIAQTSAIVRIGVYTDLNDNWEPISESPTYIGVSIAAGATALMRFIAAIAATAFADLYKSDIFDDVGFWTGQPLRRLPPEAFLKEYRAKWPRDINDVNHEWTASMDV